MAVVGVGLPGAAILLVAIGGSLALLALIVAAALYLVIFS